MSVEHVRHDVVCRADGIWNEGDEFPPWFTAREYTPYLNDMRNERSFCKGHMSVLRAIVISRSITSRLSVLRDVSMTVHTLMSAKVIMRIG